MSHHRRKALGGARGAIGGVLAWVVAATPIRRA